MSFVRTKCALGAARSAPRRSSAQVYRAVSAELYKFARTQVPTEAEAVFFGGNGFRAIGLIAVAEPLRLRLRSHFLLGGRQQKA